MAHAEPWTWSSLARRGQLALSAILLVAAIARVGALDKPFYIDEIVTITVASQTLEAMPGVMRQIDASPALYPLLLHAWITISHDDRWVRLLSALFGWLAVGAVAGVSIRAFGPAAGLCAAGVMAIAPAHVEYSQYVRSYSLFTLLATLQVWCFLAWIDRATGRPSARVWVAFAMTSTALLYTHYLSLLIFPVEGLFVLASYWRSPREILRWGAAAGLAGVLFLPGVPLLLHNLRIDAARNVERPLPPPAIDLLPNLVADLTVGAQPLGFSDPLVRRVTRLTALGLAAVLVVFGSLAAWRTRRRIWVLLTAIAWGPLLFYVVSGRRLVAIRFFLPFMVGYVAVLGLGLASLRRSVAVVAAALVVVVSVIPLWHFSTRYEWSYDHRRVAAAIQASWQPGDALLFVHPFEAFYYQWYLGRDIPAVGLVFTALQDQPGYVIKPPPLDFERARARVLEAGKTYRRFWVVGQSMRSFASDAREEARVLDWLDSTYQKVEDLGALTGHDPKIALYARREGGR